MNSPTFSGQMISCVSIRDANKLFCVKGFEFAVLELANIRLSLSAGLLYLITL